MGLSQDLLDILVCPQCKGALEYSENEAKLLCHACRLAYRIEEDVPIMLVDEAQRIDETGGG